jgi:mycothiol system anti-sigma-R factor
MISCRNCIQALYRYLDRELSDEDIVQVRQHLEECAGCLQMFRFEESLRLLVRVRCREQHAPRGLRERIEASLLAERLRLSKRTYRFK